MSVEPCYLSETEIRLAMGFECDVPQEYHFIVAVAGVGEDADGLSGPNERLGMGIGLRDEAIDGFLKIDD